MTDDDEQPLTRGEFRQFLRALACGMAVLLDSCPAWLGDRPCGAAATEDGYCRLHRPPEDAQ